MMSIADRRRKCPITCPRCEEPLFRETLSLVPSFQCTKCHASLRISRVYSVVARILAGGVALAVCLALGMSISHLPTALLIFVLIFFASYIAIAPLVAARFPPPVYNDDEENFVTLHLDG